MRILAFATVAAVLASAAVSTSSGAAGFCKLPDGSMGQQCVVATSGQHAEGDVERFRAMGFAGFLAKPYSLEHFDNVMRAALAS